MKKNLLILTLLLSVAGAWAQKERVVVAYVTSWTRTIPDPDVMTHINYAFGHVNNSFNGVRIDNEERLRRIVSLKKQKNHRNSMLPIGVL